jgi:hypothetical protein
MIVKRLLDDGEVDPREPEQRELARELLSLHPQYRAVPQVTR